MSDMTIPVKALLRNFTTFLAAAAADIKTHAHGHAASNGRTITCENGCAHCCYQKILVSGAEGVTIYAYLREVGLWTPEMVAKLTEADKRMTSMSHHDYFVEKIPCPFLAVEKPGWGQCTIYAARPISCAATFSMGDDPNLCAKTGDDDRDGQFQIAIHNSKSMNQFMTLMFNIGRFVERSSVQIMTLPGAILWAAAVVEKRRPPSVHRVLIDQHPKRVDEVFDQVAQRQSPKGEDSK